MTIHRLTKGIFPVPGLLFFVWFPFWMTGPLVGSAIGFLLGLPCWAIVVVGYLLHGNRKEDKQQ